MRRPTFIYADIDLQNKRKQKTSTFKPSTLEHTGQVGFCCSRGCGVCGEGEGWLGGVVLWVVMVSRSLLYCIEKLLFDEEYS